MNKKPITGASLHNYKLVMSIVDRVLKTLGIKKSLVTIKKNITFK